MFGIRRSIRYHIKRRQHFDRWSRRIAILGTVSGVGTVTTLLGKAGEIWTLVFASAVSVFSILDLVVRTGDAAKVHADLARQFIDIEKGIVTVGAPITMEMLRQFEAKRLEVEAEEPPPLRVLDCVCHNELLRAMGYDESEKVDLTFLQRLFANYLDWFPSSLRKASPNILSSTTANPTSIGLPPASS